MADEQRVKDTAERAYTERLRRLESVPWKRWLDVQAPYRWNIRRLQPGFVLDIGCGLGRNLSHLGGRGIGVDHNPASVQACRERGLEVLLTSDFMARAGEFRGRFDSLLLAHVLEHLTPADAVSVLRTYLPFLKPKGRVILITPQELGYRSDASHRTFMGFEQLEELAAEVGLRVRNKYSFPLPRACGHLFRHNEFVVVASE